MRSAPEKAAPRRSASEDTEGGGNAWDIFEPRAPKQAPMPPESNPGDGWVGGADLKELKHMTGEQTAGVQELRKMGLRSLQAGAEWGQNVDILS